MFGMGDFWLETMVIIQILTYPSSQETLTNFQRDEARKKKLGEKKIQNGRIKKTEFLKIVNSQHFFTNISWIGPWIRRID
jgi:hypothetical protein